MLVARPALAATIAIPRDVLDNVVTAFLARGLFQPSHNVPTSGDKLFAEIKQKVSSSLKRMEDIASYFHSSLQNVGDAVIFPSKSWEENAARVLEEFEQLSKSLEPAIEKAAELRKRADELRDLLKLLEPFREADVDLSLQPEGFGYVLFTAERETFERLLDEVGRERVIVGVYGAHLARTGYLLAFPREAESDVRKALAKHGIKPLSIPEGLPQVPRLAYEYAAGIVEKIEEALQTEVRPYWPALLKTYSRLKVLDAALNMLASAEIKGGFAILRGYVDPTRSEEVRAVLREITGGVYALSLGREESAPLVPTIVRFPRPLRPFHRLVLQYGAPLPNEIVPTLFVAFTFPAIFALMFPDAGHALAVALFGAYIYYRKKSDYGLLFVYLGIAAAITGLLSGEFFGPLTNFKYLLWGGHPPLESPIEAATPEEAFVKLAGLSLRAGAVVLIAGLAMSFANSLIVGEYEKALLSKLPKLLLFAVPLGGFVFFPMRDALRFIYDAALGGGITLYGKAIRLSFIASIVCLLLLEPLYELAAHGKASRLGSSLMSGFMEAFESILLLIGNTSSFLRIMGLALAHSGIMFGFAAMAERAFESGYLGVPLGIAAYAFGNILGIALEGIVAYAHCTRLHFYEWFTKFYSGRGRVFAPISFPSKVLFKTQL